MNRLSGASSGKGAQARVNAEAWTGRDLLAAYSGRTLRAPEISLLIRYRDALAGRVLELGCGGGRISGYLIDIADQFYGLDISATMVAHCRQMYPRGHFEQGDLRDLSRYEQDSFQAICAPFNVLDVLDDAERRDVLSAIHRLLVKDGLLIMSSHNLAYAPRIPRPTQVLSRDPLMTAKRLVRLPRRTRNWKRLQPLQQNAPDHAVLVDQAHDYSILHYYIGRDQQQHQLAELGFEMLDCLDLEGRSVGPGAEAQSHPELHYAARARDAATP